MSADFDPDGVPTAGAIITFVRRGSSEPVGSGVVVGPVYPDLDTGRWWVGVRLPAEGPGKPPAST
ncbi:hypothetical protein ACFQV2_06480 [Actinokineospora soli]|uniref:Uncharacterized protein n=1 Tax=Actinokineospora soli TaxID=1048753 RepID=A0ABW2THX8_9PSEU